MQPTISHDRREEIAWFLSGSEGRALRAAVGAGLALLGIAAGLVAALVLVPLGLLMFTLALMNVCVLDRYLHRAPETDDPPS